MRKSLRCATAKPRCRRSLAKPELLREPRTQRFLGETSGPLLRHSSSLVFVIVVAAVLLMAAAQPASAQQTLFTTQTPVLTGLDDGVSYELGMKFQASVGGQIGAIRYWKDAQESGTHVGNIWSASTGTLLASVTFVNESASGWQQQSLASPLTINGNTTYVVSVNINTHYVATKGPVNCFPCEGSTLGLFFPISNGALVSIADDHNGVFGEPATFPTNTFTFNNYFRDVVFTPGTTNPPQAAGCLEKLVSVDGGKTFAAFTNLGSPAIAQSGTPVEFELVVTNCGNLTVNQGTVDDTINADPNAPPFASGPPSAGGLGAPGLILYEPSVPTPSSAPLAPGASVTYSPAQLPNLLVSPSQMTTLCQTALQLTGQSIVRNDAQFDGSDTNGNAVSYEADAYVMCPGAPPITASCVSISAVAGVPLTPVTLVATGGAGGPYTFAATGLPPGVTMSGNGTISGTPTATGTFNYTVTITDSAGNTGTVHCSVTVSPMTPPLTLACGSATTGQVGVPYSSSLVATGGVPPYTFSIISGALPPGLTLNSSTGAITGTPTTPGTFTFVTQVTDSTGATATTGEAGCTITITPATPPQIAVTKTPDSATVAAGGLAGFTVTISNTGGSTASGLVLTDPLPPGGNESFAWAIDTTKGNPSDFMINGSPGSESLAFSSAFLASPDSLAGGQSISVHITTPTTAGDVSGGAVGLQSGVSSSAYLGAAGNYGVLYIVGSGSHNLQITNVTLGANIGVGSAVGGTGVGAVSFGGPGIITGRLDFAPGQTNQFSNNNNSNVGPSSVNKNVAAVASAIAKVTSLNSTLGALTGTSIAINGTQTINESSGTLATANGVTYRVFTVTSYNENDGAILTINGDGSGDPVVLNFGPNSGNVNLGGDVHLTGNGLNDDKVMWNFASSNQNIQLNNNASTYFSDAFHGIILAPNDGIHLVNANLSGRVFGGDNQDMQLVSGLTLHAPISNTAMVSGANVSSASSSATITFTGPFLPFAHFQ